MCLFGGNFVYLHRPLSSDARSLRTAFPVLDSSSTSVVATSNFVLVFPGASPSVVWYNVNGGGYEDQLLADALPFDYSWRHQNRFLVFRLSAGFSQTPVLIDSRADNVAALRNTLWPVWDTRLTYDASINLPSKNCSCHVHSRCLVVCSDSARYCMG